MKKDFLLEVLTQELPYKFIPSAISQLKTAFEKLLNENALNFDNIKVYATPRRLAVIVEGLAVVQDNISKDIKGPILKIAKNENGEYSPAAIGFAKKNNVDLSALYEKENYIFAHVEIKGKSAVEILKENIENLILKLQGSHFMRWADKCEKFSRPIENVVALLEDEIVNLEILDIKATNKTQGHRYSKNRELVIDKVKNYIEILKSGNVIVNQDERRELIVNEAKKCAGENNLNINFENMEELLEEVTYITEFPRAVICEFDKKYLIIPSIVTTTVMMCHQRYFPLWEKDGTLSNRFITMANFVGDDFSNIKKGNQRVITARLEDGVFFYQEDTKTKLIEKLDNLKGMTFQKGLGTLYDKTRRMIKLSDKICDELKIKEKDDILRCAELSKCDLSTKLVFEFTELQGFIGENYALYDKEKENIARGICEHYFPLGANESLPTGIEGKIISIADKIDTVCALFISTQQDKKKRPTGSNDPLGARRAAIGILRIIIENNLQINPEELIKYSLKLLSEEFSIKLEESVFSELREFFIQRLLFMYEKEFDFSTIASISSSGALCDVRKFIEKAKIITKYKNDKDFELIKENAARVSRILKDISDFSKINKDLFNLNEEKTLYEAIQNCTFDTDDLEKYIKSLNSLINPTINFFDKVLVMDKDEKIKNNRIALLKLLKDKFSVVCDFEKL